MAKSKHSCNYLLILQTYKMIKPAAIIPYSNTIKQDWSMSGILMDTVNSEAMLNMRGYWPMN